MILGCPGRRCAGQRSCPLEGQPKLPTLHDTVLYRRRHKIKTMIGSLKDWRRIHTRYDHGAHTFRSAIALAAVIII